MSDEWNQLELRLYRLYGPAGATLVEDCRAEGATPFEAAITHLDALIKIAGAEPVSPAREPGASTPAPAPTYNAGMDKPIAANKPAPKPTPQTPRGRGAKPPRKPAIIDNAKADADLVRALIGLGVNKREAIERAERATAAAPNGSIRDLIGLAMSD